MSEIDLTFFARDPRVLVRIRIRIRVRPRPSACVLVRGLRLGHWSNDRNARSDSPKPGTFAEPDMGQVHSIEITEEGSLDLSAYASVSIAYQVSQVFDFADSPASSGAFDGAVRTLSDPYLKDYDQAFGNAPTEWPQHYDLANWGLFGAHSNGQRLGSAAVAFDTPGLDVLEGRRDLAVLWDLRVEPQARGRGVGLSLFRAAERWARAKGCRTLKIETQNTNLPACQFYARRGCSLGKIQRSAYQEFPHEVQMLWYKDLIVGG